MPDGRARAIEYVCQQRFTLQLVLYGGSVGILLNLAALLTLDSGTAGYTVALVNFPGLVFFVLLAAVIIRKCATA